MHRDRISLVLLSLTLAVGAAMSCTTSETVDNTGGQTGTAGNTGSGGFGGGGAANLRQAIVRWYYDFQPWQRSDSKLADFPCGIRRSWNAGCSDACIDRWKAGVCSQRRHSEYSPESIYWSPSDFRAIARLRGKRYGNRVVECGGRTKRCSTCRQHYIDTSSQHILHD